MNRRSFLKGLFGTTAVIATGGATAVLTALSKLPAQSPPPVLPPHVMVAARTCGFDLVSVIPMQGPTGLLTYMDYVYAGDGRCVPATDAPRERQPRESWKRAA